MKDKPIGRIAQLIAVVGLAPRGLEIAEIAGETGIPFPTVHRMVVALSEVGLLRWRGKGYRVELGSLIQGLSNYGMDPVDFAAVCRPIMVPVSEELGSISFLMRRIGNHADTVLQVMPTKAINSIVLPGLDNPLHATASGKLFLAEMDDPELADALSKPLRRYRPSTITSVSRLKKHLEEVRRLGFATCKDEYDEGVFSIAFPVRVPLFGLLFACGVLGFEYSLLELRAENELRQFVQNMASKVEVSLKDLFERRDLPYRTRR
jgi:DNA-binding IclR family transcriptional regulator